MDTDGEHVPVNAEPQRQRAGNLGRNPRITVLIQAAGDPWDWSEVRGHVAGTIAGEEARRHIDELPQVHPPVPAGPVAPQDGGAGWP